MPGSRHGRERDCTEVGVEEGVRPGVHVGMAVVVDVASADSVRHNHSSHTGHFALAVALMAVVQSRVQYNVRSAVEAAVELLPLLLPSMQSSLEVQRVVGQVAEAVAEGYNLAGEQTDSCSSHTPDGCDLSWTRGTKES